ncbi:MAG: phage tail assembly chaperone [Rhizobiales bacterium]|jgi:uncharacterized phage protein (TIGR02216 family)|nr:phage tail assembly chaperone [Hyphomicrobiales bacterium]
MAFGLGLLRLCPEAFWSMTLQEFAAALRGAKGEFASVAPLDATGLHSLMTMFPDGAEEVDHDRRD